MWWHKKGSSEHGWVQVFLRVEKSTGQNSKKFFSHLEKAEGERMKRKIKERTDDPVAFARESWFSALLYLLHALQLATYPTVLWTAIRSSLSVGKLVFLPSLSDIWLCKELPWHGLDCQISFTWINFLNQFIMSMWILYAIPEECANSQGTGSNVVSSCVQVRGNSGLYQLTGCVKL